MNKTEIIAQQNDSFRKYGATTEIPGQTFMTSGISSLHFPLVVRISAAVQCFKEFSEDNDPHGEHDFGAIDIDGVAGRIFWKIDYYADGKMEYGAEDPASCYRVMTIMLASEY